MSVWVGYIIVTIALPEPRLFRNRAFEFSLKYKMLDRRTRSSGAATQDLCDQEGFVVQLACSMQTIATGNQVIFGADEILAKDRVTWLQDKLQNIGFTTESNRGQIFCKPSRHDHS
jgi:hypothetical protein